MEKLRARLFKELRKNGYAKNRDGKRVWNLANRSFLYMTPKLVEAFLEMRKHPRYRETVVNIEIELLKNHAVRMLKGFKQFSFNLIDMGCGDGTKARVFIENLNEGCKIRFCPVSVNQTLVNLAMENVKKANFSNVYEYKPYTADLESLDEVIGLVRGGEYQRDIILLLGSILASFEIHDYLFNLSKAMFSGDILIIGNGIRKGERLSGLENYKHTLFRDWLINIVRELGFEDDEIEYDARFENGRVEGFFRVKKNKKIRFDGGDIDFRDGDEILVAILYKYYEKEIKKYCRMYFRNVDVLTDLEKEYSLVICSR